MSPIENGPKDVPIRLLPHQAAFVETCFNPLSKRVIELHASAGLGKTSAFAALSSRLLHERPTARVLYLARASLLSQFMQVLGASNIRSVLVDRYQFREMLDSTTEGEFWPSGTVVVVSLDFAKLPEIRSSLAEVRWNWIIVDEAHALVGDRADAVKLLCDAAEHVIFATIRGIEQVDGLTNEDATKVVWRYDQIIGENGAIPGNAMQPKLHEVAFNYCPAELSLLAIIETLCRIFEAGDAQQDWVANLLRRSYQSSPAALEHVLLRLAEGQGALDAIWAPLEYEHEEMPGHRLAAPMDSKTGKEIIAIARRALQEIEALGSDSKLSAFSGLLARLSDAKISARRICVITDYVETLYYLVAEIEDKGMVCQLLHGGMSVEKRQDALTQVSNMGTILIATRALMVEGIDLRAVTDLVLYDVPGRNDALQAVLGRFDRSGRRGRLSVHVLTPSNDASGPTSEAIRLFHEVFERRGSEPI